MKIYKLQIEGYKNLQDLTIQFDESNSSFNTVIVGENGAGKSNILEAIILIFRDLDLGKNKPLFKYIILYKCHGNMITIDADPLRKRNIFNITVNNDKVSYKKFKDLRRKLFLPNYVFGYYSGPSNRMESLFEIHQKKFYDILINKENAEEDENLRPLLYARHIHSQFALLSFFTESEDKSSEFLKNYLGIEGFDSALFVIREPPWDSDEGDQRFWNARGSVQRFLGKLYDISLAPLRLKQYIHIDFRRRATLEHMYLYVRDINTLKELSRQYQSPQEFFKALESTYISKLISAVRIRVKIRTKEGSLTFSELSEGEQQLLMVLGLLKFTREAESIFLLDEPDTHLNPKWSVSYLKILKDVFGEQETSQIIMTTHDPLVISGLTRSQVIILRFDEKKKQFIAEHPEYDPIKMGYPEILTSDIFKLKSIINPEIERLLNLKRALSIKDVLSSEELKRLSELNKELDGFDFTEAVKDPLYEPFIRAMTEIRAEEKFEEPVLTKEQFEKRRQMAKEILQKIKLERDHPL
jgi:predicted ATPase